MSHRAPAMSSLLWTVWLLLPMLIMRTKQAPLKVAFQTVRNINQEKIPQLRDGPGDKEASMYTTATPGLNYSQASLQSAEPRTYDLTSKAVDDDNRHVTSLVHKSAAKTEESGTQRVKLVTSTEFQPKTGKVNVTEPAALVLEQILTAQTTAPVALKWKKRLRGREEKENSQLRIIYSYDKTSTSHTHSDTTQTTSSKENAKLRKYLAGMRYDHKSPHSVSVPNDTLILGVEEFAESQVEDRTSTFHKEYAVTQKNLISVPNVINNTATPNADITVSNLKVGDRLQGIDTSGPMTVYFNGELRVQTPLLSSNQTNISETTSKIREKIPQINEAVQAAYDMQPDYHPYFTLDHLNFKLRDLILAVMATVATITMTATVMTALYCCCRKKKKGVKTTEFEPSPNAAQAPTENSRSDSTVSLPPSVNGTTVQDRFTYSEVDLNSPAAVADDLNTYNSAKSDVQNVSNSKKKGAKTLTKPEISVLARIKALEIKSDDEEKVNGVAVEKPKKKRPCSKAFEEFESQGIVIGMGRPKKKPPIASMEEDLRVDATSYLSEASDADDVTSSILSDQADTDKESHKTGAHGEEEEELHTEEKDTDDDNNFSGIQRESAVLKSFRRAPPPNRTVKGRPSKKQRGHISTDADSDYQDDPKPSRHKTKLTGRMPSDSTSIQENDQQDSNMVGGAPVYSSVMKESTRGKQVTAVKREEYDIQSDILQTDTPVNQLTSESDYPNSSDTNSSVAAQRSHTWYDCPNSQQQQTQDLLQDDGFRTLKPASDKLTRKFPYAGTDGYNKETENELYQSLQRKIQHFDQTKEGFHSIHHQTASGRPETNGYVSPPEIQSPVHFKINNAATLV